MVMKKVLLSSMIMLVLTTSTASAAYKEVSCGTDKAFSENSCTQCFGGDPKSE
jgi:hypothetical protein